MDFSRLTAYLDQLKDCPTGIPACDCAVYVRHEEVYRHFSGCSDEQNAVPMNGRETYFFYSATKMFTCVAILQLIERGLLGLDDPVAKYIPAYTLLTVKSGDITRAAKRPMTIRHLMSMQSGLDYDLNAKAILNAKETYGAEATTAQLVDAIAHKPLCFDPGEDYQYCLGHDVLGEVVEVVSGKTFGEYLRENIMEPLGMKDIGFARTPSRMNRLCAQYMRSEQTGENIPTGRDNPYILAPKYESGGAGLIGDVDDYVLLLDALACGGVGRTGARILTPKTIDLYRTPQLTGRSYTTFKRHMRIGYTYALGVRAMENPPADPTRKGNIGEFGWDGAAGAFALVDPKYELSIFYAQHVRNFGWIYHNAHPIIRSLSYEALGLL